ncbi:CinY protein [Actinoplanes sp. NPDC051513]|uniref:CinY protein n=1 Tax=Actinoplanes sp. NPDC051513 TaxID=3363908 RepID=UPI0037982F68
MRRRRCAVLLSLLLLAWIASAPTPAVAFGTIDGGGQHREHERITRAALACTNGESACFEPATMNYLAGHDREFGAVGAPDSDEMADPAAHCDDADYLAGSYPRTREAAGASLTDCVEQLRGQFRTGLDSAKDLLDDQGEVMPDEVTVSPECNPREREESRAKCTTMEAFGRVLHGAQDFYSHSNWADQADPDRPIGDDNPPGLHRPGPSPLLDLRGATVAGSPANFTTGCYVLQDQVPGVGACELRITHAALNKDRGLIDPVDGRATEPGTPRGQVRDNFADAVAGAIIESRRQWQDFGTELTARYGADRGTRMICALTHDDPVQDCHGRHPNWAAIIALAAAGAALVVVVVLIRRFRRRPRG